MKWTPPALPPVALRIVPIAVPVVVLALAYFVLIGPIMTQAKRAQAQLPALRARLASLGTLQGQASAGPDSGENVLHDFELRVPADDRLPDLLEEIARLALEGAEGEEVRNLLIETGDRVDLATGDPATGPRAGAGPEEAPDPRFTLFPGPLAYTPVTVTFETSYAALGRFLWNVRGLPTTVEIRALEIEPVVGAAPSSVRARLVFFAFQRPGAVPPRAAGPSDNRTG